MDITHGSIASHARTDWLIVGLEIDVRVLPRMREICICHSDLTKAITAEESAASHIAISWLKELNRRIQGIAGRHVRPVAQVLHTAWNQFACSAVVYEYRHATCHRVVRVDVGHGEVVDPGGFCPPRDGGDLHPRARRRAEPLTGLQ